MALLAASNQRNELLQNLLTSYVGFKNAENLKDKPLQFRTGMPRKISERNPLPSLKKELISVGKSKTTLLHIEANLREDIRSVEHKRVGRAFENIK